MARKRTGISGPFKHGRRWRVVRQEDGTRRVLSFEKEEEAQAYIDEWRACAEGETVRDAMERWLKAVASRGRAPLTVPTLRNAVARILPFLPAKLDDVTPAIAGRAYADLVATGCAVDTHRNSLNTARSMWQFLLGKGASTPWDAVTGVGKRKKGKPQLTIDESRRFLSAALEHGDRGLAAAICLCLALRAGEVVAITGRDVDDGGRLVWIWDGKSENARRCLEVPEVLRPALQAIASEAGDRRLFPYSRGWVGYWVGEIRTAANVRKVSPHGLRGTHATIAAAAGATGHLVAAALGHAGPEVTREHYIAPGAERSATARKLGTMFENRDPKRPSDHASSRN
jgi:integrase